MFKNEVQNNNGKIGQKQEVNTWWIGPEPRFLGNQSPGLTLVPAGYSMGAPLLAAEPLPRFTRLLKGSDKEEAPPSSGPLLPYALAMPLLTVMSLANMSPCSSHLSRVSLFSGSLFQPQTRARSPQPARKTWNSLLPHEGCGFTCSPWLHP